MNTLLSLCMRDEWNSIIVVYMNMLLNLCMRCVITLLSLWMRNVGNHCVTYDLLNLYRRCLKVHLLWHAWVPCLIFAWEMFACVAVKNMFILLMLEMCLCALMPESGFAVIHFTVCFVLCDWKTRLFYWCLRCACVLWCLNEGLQLYMLLFALCVCDWKTCLFVWCLRCACVLWCLSEGLHLYILLFALCLQFLWTLLVERWHSLLIYVLVQKYSKVFSQCNFKLEVSAHDILVSHNVCNINEGYSCFLFPVSPLYNGIIFYFILYPMTTQIVLYQKIS